jgi:Spy/CpxP family protein refolding chaperone
MNESLSPATSTKSRRIPWIVSIAAAAALFAAGVAVVAAHGSGWNHDWSDEQVAEHIQEHVNQMLDGTDATPEQRAQVTTILQSAAHDVLAIHEQHAAVHAKLKQILSAPQIDRAQIETLRQQQVQALDSASQRLSAALADAAEVLSPEQRKQLFENIEKRHHHWHH